jgi:hypothetical protein
LPESADTAEHAVICSNSESVTIRQESVEVEIPPVTREENNTVVTGDPVICEESVDIEIPAILDESVEVVAIDDYENGWEEDLDECIHGDGVSIRGWEELRQQIKKDLKNHRDILPITKINQLLVIRNFAILRLKGYGKIEASTEIAWQWHEGEGKQSYSRLRVYQSNHRSSRTSRCSGRYCG